MSVRKVVDVAEMIRLYTQEKLSCEAVGQRVGENAVSVWRWLTEAGVMRTGTEANKLVQRKQRGYRRT